MAPGGEEAPERGGIIKEFVCNHMKTLVTIFMIFGTIAVIVLIVMLHKLKYESQLAAQERACLDVAIVGGGLSGTYAAWRLRYSGYKVHVFEMSDRIGGRFYTRHLNGLQDVPAEMGALYYSPQLHPRLNGTIHALKLRPTQFLPRSRGPSIFYLRGVHLQEAEIGTNKVPYHLENHETNKFPDQLKQMYLHMATTNYSDVLQHPLEARTKDGSHLYKHGYWNVLGTVASREGYNFLYDTARFRSLYGNENAALLGSVPSIQEEQLMTVAEGMDAIPKTMAEEFLNNSETMVLREIPLLELQTHDVNMNRRLACIHRRPIGYKLIFINTQTEHGITRDIQETSTVCAKRVILALPKRAIEEINWNPFRENRNIRRHIDTVEEIPAIRIYFIYNRTWWGSQGPPQVRHITTDLPIRNVMYIGGTRPKPYKKKSEKNPEKHIFMVTNADAQDTEYFSDLISKMKRGVNCTPEDSVIKDITSQLAKAYKVELRHIPPPEQIIIQDWSSSGSRGGWYMWKKGVKWDKVIPHILRPHKKDDVFIVGSTYCGGHCQLWAEGALETVDLLFEKYFPER